MNLANEIQFGYLNLNGIICETLFFEVTLKKHVNFGASQLYR